MQKFLLGICVFILISCQNNKQKEANTTSTDSLTKQPVAIDSLNTTTGTDTSFTDLSGRFRVTIPSYPDSTLPNIQGLNVAVIPVDSIGAVKIPWNDNQQQLTKETEKEFETELLQCIGGKDKTGEASAETKIKNGYCERTGYGDAAMGQAGYNYYCALKKDNNLVIIEMMTLWPSCTTGFQTEKERKACRAEQDKAEKSIEDFIGKTVAALKVKRF